MNKMDISGKIKAYYERYRVAQTPQEEEVPCV